MYEFVRECMLTVCVCVFSVNCKKGNKKLKAKRKKQEEQAPKGEKAQWHALSRLEFSQLHTLHVFAYTAYTLYSMSIYEYVRSSYTWQAMLFSIILSSCPFLSLYYFFVESTFRSSPVCVCIWCVLFRLVCMCSSQLFISFSLNRRWFRMRTTIALEHSLSLSQFVFFQFRSFISIALFSLFTVCCIDCCTSRIFLLRFLFAMKLDRRWKESKAILSRNRRAHRSQASLSLTHDDTHTALRKYTHIIANFPDFKLKRERRWEMQWNFLWFSSWKAVRWREWERKSSNENTHATFFARTMSFFRELIQLPNHSFRISIHTYSLSMISTQTFSPSFSYCSLESLSCQLCKPHDWISLVRKSTANVHKC